MADVMLRQWLIGFSPIVLTGLIDRILSRRLWEIPIPIQPTFEK